MGSPEAARELAEAQARSTAAYARSKPRSRPGSNAPTPAPQGAPAVALTYAVAIAPDDALAPLSSFGTTPDCAHEERDTKHGGLSMLDCAHEERDAKHGELSVLAVTVAPPSPHASNDPSQQGLLQCLPVTVQAPDFPFLINQRLLETQGFPIFSSANEAWLRAPTGSFYRLAHDKDASLCLPVECTVLDDNGPAVLVGSANTGRPTMMLKLDNCSQATCIPSTHAHMVFALSQRPGVNVSSATGHHGVSLGFGTLRLLFREGSAAPNMMSPYPPASLIAAILGPTIATTPAPPAPTASSYVVTRSHARNTQSSGPTGGSTLPTATELHDPGGSPAEEATVQTRAARRPFSTAGTPSRLHDPDVIAARFNVFSRDELKYFDKLVDGVAPLKLKDNDSYGQVALLYQAAMKRRPIHRELSQSSHVHLLDTPPGSCWDFDV